MPISPLSINLILVESVSSLSLETYFTNLILMVYRSRHQLFLYVDKSSDQKASVVKPIRMVSFLLDLGMKDSGYICMYVCMHACMYMHMHIRFDMQLTTCLDQHPRRSNICLERDLKNYYIVGKIRINLQISYNSLVIHSHMHKIKR